MMYVPIAKKKCRTDELLRGFIAAAISEYHRSGLIAAVFLAGRAPAYSWMAYRRQLRAAQLLAV
jgi:hypothetical protein